jgi:transcription elongation factor Elf1
MTRQKPDEMAECPHCKKAATVPLSIEGCGVHACEYCGKNYRVYIDEDTDCNYWFGVEPE